MHTTGKLGTVLAGATLVVGVSASALAAPATNTTYSGSFGGEIVYTGCDDAGAVTGSHETTGTWSVTTKTNGHAVGTFEINVDGQPHVAYSTPLKAGSPVTGADFVQTYKSKAGPLTVTLEEGIFSYTIAPYDFYTPDSMLDGTYVPMHCTSVTYPGNVGLN